MCLGSTREALASLGLEQQQLTEFVDEMRRIVLEKNLAPFIPRGMNRGGPSRSEYLKARQRNSRKGKSKK